MEKGIAKKDFLLAHPAIEATASEYGKSPAQVLLKWALQHDFYIIPKSIHHERIKQNISLEDFSLTKQQMAAIDGIIGKKLKNSAGTLPLFNDGNWGGREANSTLPWRSQPRTQLSNLVNKIRFTLII